MADMTPEAATIAGTVLTVTAAADPITFSNVGRNARIIAYNTSGATRTFEAVTTQLIETDLAVADRTYSVGTGTYEYIGSFDTNVYNDGSDEVTLQTFNSVTGLVFICLAA